MYIPKNAKLSFDMFCWIFPNMYYKVYIWVYKIYIAELGNFFALVVRIVRIRTRVFIRPIKRMVRRGIEPRPKEGIMKAIVSSRRNSVNFVNSSSVRNSLTYVMRARRISAPGTDTRLESLDTITKFRKCWDHWGNLGTYIDKEYDRLQYILAYSNNNLHQNPDDIFSIARGKEVTAENLYEEAEECYKLAEKCRKKAETLRYDATVYNCRTYVEYATMYEEDAAAYEDESRRYYDWAVDMDKAAEYFKYEAENMVEEERFVSGWETWLDM